MHDNHIAELSLNELRKKEQCEEIKSIILTLTNKLVLPLYFIFWICDLIYVPQLKWEFLALRGLTIPLALIVHHLIKVANTLKSLQFIALGYAFAMALPVTSMIWVIGDPASPYYAGLCLVAMATLSFIPWSPGYFISAVFAIFIPFYLVEFVLVQTTNNIFSVLIISFFIGGTVVITAIVRIFYEKFRLKELQQRLSLQTEIRRRKEMELAVVKVNSYLIEANKNKDIFLANISHELRTPLTLILTPLEGMLQDAERFYSHDYNAMETMHDNGLSLLRQINDLLDLTRLQDGRLRLRFKEVGIVTLIESIVSRVSATAEKKGITVAFNAEGDVNQLYLDTDKFEKVIINLISNALKFTPREGRIDIVVYGSANSVVVDVSDTGIGIPKNQLEAVFERFVQVDGTNTRQYGGTGIGLSLVKDIVELHGGEVTVVSEEGEGSTFSLQLLKGTTHIKAEDRVDQETDTGDEVEALKYSRLVKSADFVDDAEQDIAPLVAELQVGCESTIKLLIVEDNPDMYRLVANMLRQDYLVDIACNGEQGLAKARMILPDIIVSDVMMPKMTGIEMLFEIRHDLQLEHIPVILLSSKADISNKIVGLEKGADDYIAKPFNPRELQARIKTLLIHQQYERQLAQKNNALQTANTTLEKALKDLADSQAQLVHTERLATVGQLAANVAHEINTPLFSAKNCVSVLERKLTTEREKDIVATLSGVLQDIQRQVQSMLGFSKKNQEKGFEWVDVHDGLNDTLTLLQFQLDDIGITVHCEFSVSEKVEVDIQQLNQVFLNILNNAIYAIQVKSAKGGHLWVTTSIEHDWLKLSIRDNGCGMSSDVVAQVFDPFYTTKSSGTGLGLAICRQIIMTTHSGDIVVESEVGEGTTFTITVPVSQAVDTELKSA